MDQQPKLQLTCIALAVAATLYGVSPAYADTLVAAEAQAEQGEAKKDEAKKDEDKKAKKKDEVEVLEVRGIRENVSKQLSIKENATGVMDVVLAEDIGKFPDENLADALQRIAGIQVTRGNGNGEAQKITVRGMTGSFVQTTWNGRKLASEDQGRDFNYDVMSSDLVGGIEVFKSSEARLSEGGIAANVNIKTRSPLALKGFTVAGSVKANYESRTEDVLPQMSFLVGDKTDDDKWGYIATLSYAKKTIRVDRFTAYGFAKPFTEDAPTGWNYERMPWDVNKDGHIEGIDTDDGPEGLPSAFGTGLYFQNQQDEAERAGASFAVQWAPTDRLNLTVDSLVSRYRNANNFYQLGLILHDEAHTPGLMPLQEIKLDGQGRVNYARYGKNSIGEILNIRNPRVTDAVAIGFNADWQVSDSLKLKFDVATSSAENKTDGDARFIVTRGFMDSLVVDKTGSGRLPSISMPNFNSKSLFGAHYSYVNGDNMEDQVDQFAFDGTWEPDNSKFASVHFGLGQTSSTKEREYYRSINPSMFSRGGFYLDQGMFGKTYPYPAGMTFEPSGWEGMKMFRIPESVFRDANFSDFMKGEGSNVQPWPSFDWDALMAFYRTINNDAVNDGIVPLTPQQLIERFPTSSAFRSVRNDSYNIEETVKHAYVQTRFEHEVAGLPYFIDFGVRFVDVTTGSVNWLADWDNAAFRGNGQVETVTSNWSRTFHMENPQGGYSRNLPSVNFKLSLTPELQVRASAARTMTRPDIDKLRAVANAQGKLGKTGKPLITLGNPNLEPYEANTYNASIEWYFAPASALSLTLFQNDVLAYFEDHEQPGSYHGKQYDIQMSRMGEYGQNYGGYEVAYHQSFDKILPAPFDGLGVILNYTNLESEYEDPELAGFPVPQLAKHQYNFIVFYEKDNIEARIGYNWRDSTLDWVYQRRGEWFEEFGKLDVSFAYKFDDHWKAFFEATNLTNEAYSKYDTVKDQTSYMERFGTQMTVGVRARF